MGEALVVHVKRDPYDVYVGRANSRAGLEGSIWANPFRIGDAHPETGRKITRGAAVKLYKQWILRGEGRPLLRRLGELENVTLACWCAPKGGVRAHDPLVCHGQVLLLLLEHRAKKISEKRSARQGPDPVPDPVPERYVICGSRSWDETTAIREELARLPEGAVVVVGGARGADRIAERLARRRGLAVEVYPARWDEEGKCAGFRRNKRMLDLPGVRAVLAFRTGGKSTGTDHMVGISRDAGIDTSVFQPAKLSPA